MWVLSAPTPHHVCEDKKERKGLPLKNSVNGTIENVYINLKNSWNVQWKLSLLHTSSDSFRKGSDIGLAQGQRLLELWTCVSTGKALCCLQNSFGAFWVWAPGCVYCWGACFSYSSFLAGLRWRWWWRHRSEQLGALDGLAAAVSKEQQLRTFYPSDILESDLGWYPASVSNNINTHWERVFALQSRIGKEESLIGC